MAMRPVPSTFPVTQSFRQNLTQYNVGAAHGAIDYATPVGTPIVAPEDGIISYADFSYNLPGGPNDWVARKFQIKPPYGVFMGPNAGGGIMTFLQNSVGSTWIFAHLSSNNIAPKGKRVRKGDIIGYTGNTGSSTGPHLHLALIPGNANWSNGFFGGIDPAPYLTEAYRTNSPAVVDNKTTSEGVLNGIDVSAYQPGNIVTRVSSDFVIVKTTEGVGWQSNVWRQQLADARRLKKKVGVYHFARPMSNGSDAEADYFYNIVKSEDFPGLVWFLDWEEEGAYAYTEWARDFMARLDSKTKKQTGLYANTQALIGGVWSAADKTRPLWRAYPLLKGTGYATSFSIPAPPAGWKKLVMDQYSFFGRLPGYTGDLDLNVYYGGLPEWGAVGSAQTDIADTPKTLLEEIMSTPAERKAFAKEVAKETAREILDTRITLTGNDPLTGKPYAPGTTSLRQELGWGTFRGFRDRRIEAGVVDANDRLNQVLHALLDPAEDTGEADAGSTTVEESK